ncbi:CYFA0S06e01332g1_1 [Cyberlindnera fabianii]|uniref:CYFA0S06e01332g1_1 n=1 Tax=Cyberlindnera fabianii TaxID=36022 RepID=A0A061AU57_CYBFA|nr:CYFA0S06e01332g1_1 [Cyberlindnera fabianii]
MLPDDLSPVKQLPVRAVQDEDMEDDDISDTQPMELFDMNNVVATAKHISPKKQTRTPAATQHSLPQTIRSRSNQRISGSIQTPSHPSTQNKTPMAHLSPKLLFQTPSSVHLSEFIQPPQGTSTPAPGGYLDGIETPRRPASYFAPIFRFVSNDSFDTDASVISGQTSLLPPTASSPLSHKSRIMGLKDEISIIVDRMKTSVMIKSLDEQTDTEILMPNNESTEVSASLQDVSEISKIPFSQLSTSTPKSIMKKRSIDYDGDAIDQCKANKHIKRVRINETVDVITSTERKVKNKRPLSSTTDRINRKRIRGPKGATPVMSTYNELLGRCRGTKDPLNILLG